jgi:ribosome recycling factor
LKTYISEVEGLLMYSPAVFLHKGQKLMAAQDTLEILQALAAGNIVLVDEDKISKVEIPEPELQSEEKTDTAQITDNIFETIKPARRGIRK